MTGIIGAICGDIIGSTYERLNFKKDKKVEKIPYDFNIITKGMRPTDDSVCTLAVADWLMHTNRTNDELIDKLHYWCTKYYFGFAGMFRKWIDNKSREPYNSYGNGSAMRVSPVGWYAKTEDECLMLAKQSAEVTHNHPYGISGAQCVALAIFYVRQGMSKDEILKKLIEKFPEFDFTKSYDEIYPDYKFECINQVSIPACIACWYESTSYEDCVRKAIALTGDTDTEACIAGAICNANPETQITADWMVPVFDHVEHLTFEMLAIINEFHKKYEV